MATTHHGGGLEETLHLEGFGESLKGRRAYIVAKSPRQAQRLLRSRLTLLDGEVAHRGRKVLVVQGPNAAPKWLAGLGWDAAFHVRDATDLKLAATVIQHCARPTRVVWTGQDPAPSVLSMLSRMEGVSLLGLGVAAPTGADWQAIFWCHEAEQVDVEPAITLRMGTAGTNGLRAVLKELRGSEVGLVWSSIEEADKRGGLYWYDPREGAVEDSLNLVEAAETLRAVADYVVGGGHALGRG